MKRKIGKMFKQYVLIKDYFEISAFEILEVDCMSVQVISFVKRAKLLNL